MSAFSSSVLAVFALQRQKRGRGRPRKPAATLLTGGGRYDGPGRPRGRVKYTADNVRWLVQRLAARVLQARNENRRLTMRQAIYEEGVATYLDFGRPRLVAERMARARVPALYKLLSRRLPADSAPTR